MSFWRRVEWKMRKGEKDVVGEEEETEYEQRIKQQAAESKYTSINKTVERFCVRPTKSPYNLNAVIIIKSASTKITITSICKIITLSITSSTIARILESHNVFFFSFIFGAFFFFCRLLLSTSVVILQPIFCHFAHEHKTPNICTVTI